MLWTQWAYLGRETLCLRLSLTETKRVDGVFLEKDELHPLWTEIEYSERSCGHSFQILSTSQYRVVISSGSLSIYSSSLGKSQYRPIRNDSELQGDNKDWCDLSEGWKTTSLKLFDPPDKLPIPEGNRLCSSSVYSNLSGQDLSHCSSIFTTARSSQLSSRCSTARTSISLPTHQSEKIVHFAS
jgi:hypothetical protein